MASRLALILRGLLASALLLQGCWLFDRDDGEPIVVKAIVGPEGGTLTHPAGGTIRIPAGALAEAVELSMVPVEAPSPEMLGAPAAGSAFLLGPEGQTFLVPVEVELPFDASSLAADYDRDLLRVLTAPKDGTSFTELPTRVESEKLVALTTHFSFFVPSAPPSAMFVLPTSLPEATRFAAYDQTLSGTGGTAPYTFTVDWGKLPPGLALATGGALTGTPQNAGSYTFTVRAVDATGRAVEKQFTLTVVIPPAPIPTLTALDPDEADQGSLDVTVLVSGTGFVPESLAVWEDDLVSPLATTWISSTELQVVIPAGRLTEPGEFALRVVNPPQPGENDLARSSDTLPFTVVEVQQNPLPVLLAVSPSTIPAGNTDVQITLTGTDFIESSFAVTGTEGIGTLFISDTELAAVIPAAHLATPGTLQISVYTPPPAGGLSYPVTVTITSPLPRLHAIDPIRVPVGLDDLWVTLSGENLQVDGAARVLADDRQIVPQTYGNAVRAVVPSADLAQAKTMQIAFRQSSGVTSQSLPLRVAPAATEEKLFEVASGSISHLAANDSSVFFFHYDGGKFTLMRRPFGFDGNYPLASDLLGASLGIVPHGDVVYFALNANAQINQGRIYSVPADGGTVTTVATESGLMAGPVADATHLYYVVGAGQLKRVAHGSTTPELVATGMPQPYWGTVTLALDDTHVYFGQVSSGQGNPGPLGRVAKTGGTPEVLLRDYIHKIEVDDDELVFLRSPSTGYVSNEIRRVAKTGTEAAPVFPTQVGMNMGPLEGDGLFYMAPTGPSQGYRLHRRPLDGSPASVLTLTTSIMEAVLTTNSIYFISGYTSLYRMDKPGVPVIADITPGEVPAGSPDTEIVITLEPGTLEGTARVFALDHFGPELELDAEVTGPDEITAVLPASRIATANRFPIVVRTGAGTSQQKIFFVTNPAPTLTSMTPDAIETGTEAVALELTGSDFAQGGWIMFGELRLETEVVSSTLARVTVPAQLRRAPATFSVTFVNAGPGGGASNALSFEVFGDALAEPPKLYEVDRWSVRVGSNDLPVSIYAEFSPTTELWVSSSNGSLSEAVPWVELWGGYYLATIPARFFEEEASLQIQAFEPANGGGWSERDWHISVGNEGYEVPVITSISPEITTMDTLTRVVIHGTNLAATSWMWFDSQLFGCAWYGDRVELDVKFPLAAGEDSRVVPIAVVSGEPGGGASLPLELTVVR